MSSRLVAAALRLPAVFGVLAIARVGRGLYAYRLDVEAYPNPVASRIELITQPNGWSTEEGERHVAVPLEIGRFVVTYAQRLWAEGSQAQKPLAIVVIGGALIVAVLPRLFQSATLLLAHRRDRPRRSS